jgi:hypothetical protein
VLDKADMSVDSSEGVFSLLRGRLLSCSLNLIIHKMSGWLPSMIKCIFFIIVITTVTVVVLFVMNAVMFNHTSGYFLNALNPKAKFFWTQSGNLRTGSTMVCTTEGEHS